MSDNPKYSIIIPTYNGLKYLPTCIESIISQEYENFEVIISDDHSSDGTKEYLERLKHKKIKVIYPSSTLSMTEHWEWALTHARGEWQIFVGQDDGLQPYFFNLADKLTKIANQNKLRTIMSSRAYFFWKGCEFVYGDFAVSYKAINEFKIHNMKYESLKALLGFQDYFELPQMYTTSLFHRDLLQEARLKQGGKLFCCHPQDANLAAIALALEKNYLKSYIPLGWVGSSVKSAGMAIFSDTTQIDEKDAEEIIQLREDYKKKISNSELKYNKLAGDFSFGNLSLYFWQALLQTSSIQSQLLNKLLNSKVFKLILFSNVYKEITYRNDRKKEQSFKRILDINNLEPMAIYYVAKFDFIFNVIKFLLNLPVRIKLKMAPKVVHTLLWKDSAEVNMIKESHTIKSKISENDWI